MRPREKERWRQIDRNLRWSVRLLCVSIGMLGLVLIIRVVS